LRPGEKLYEELFDNSEKIISTVNKKFKMAIPETPSYDELLQYMAELEDVVCNNDVDKIIPIIKRIVPNFQHEEISNVGYRMIM
jgi:O-antigen biosynthesis protein WbqV